MPETARRADVPPTRPASGVSQWMVSFTNTGMQTAKPSINRNNATNPTTRLEPGIFSNTNASATAATPDAARNGSRRRVRCSRTDRVIASCGLYDAASMAGTAAARTVAPKPATNPLATDHGLTRMSVTLILKYRSLIDLDTSTSSPSPNQIPSATPRIAPANPRMAASAMISLNASFRVRPNARSTPMSPRRCKTVKLTLL